MATLDIPPSDQVMPGSHQLPRISFPPPLDESVLPPDPHRVVREWASCFTDLFNAGKTDVSAVFLPESYWRDLSCMTWNFHTFHGPDSVSNFVSELPSKWRIRKIEVDESSEFRKPKVAPIDFLGELKCVQSFVVVDTDVGRGNGLVRLLPSNDGSWKAYTLLTVLQELKGHEEKTHTRRPRGVEHVSRTKRDNWQDERRRERDLEDTEPAVLIIGCGQGGLAVAARLKQLGVRSLIVDRIKRVGDNWRKRYHHLVLHDSVWFDHMPYLNFPPHWPIFTPKDKLADWFESYAKILDLNIWTSTAVQHSAWNSDTKSWDVTLSRDCDGSNKTYTLHPRHLILATGASGKPRLPSIPGFSSFNGGRILHSSAFEGFPPGHSGQGKRVVVVGSSNSAHDIAQDYHEHGYAVTMSQRSSTHVVSCQTLVDVTMAGLYCGGGPPVGDADMINHSFPWPVLARFQVDATVECASRDAPLLSGLQAADFRLDAGPHAAGLWNKYLSRGGGYYIDTGCSALIATGAIALKPAAITCINPHSITFADGDELSVDEIVCATGFGNMQESAAEIFGEEVSEAAGPVWGFDAERETRGMWRKGRCEGFWYMGGNLALCRFYSLRTALVIKAMEERLCTWTDP